MRLAQLRRDLSDEVLLLFFAVGGAFCRLFGVFSWMACDVSGRLASPLPGAGVTFLCLAKEKSPKERRVLGRTAKGAPFALLASFSARLAANHAFMSRTSRVAHVRRSPDRYSNPSTPPALICPSSERSEDGASGRYTAPPGGAMARNLRDPLRVPFRRNTLGAVPSRASMPA
ncbi:hypothetical protein BURPS668_2728 [Burkholderia pseudomallei 668]|nr:hypothetical protein BURPS668_2728 [Burkholderia pseudomallei 668]